MSRSILTLAIGTCLLTGCVTIPEPLRGEFSTLAPDQPGAAAERVRWGGRLIEVLPAADQTCLEILGMPLDSSARPQFLDADIGRFRACKAGFFDPAVFISGREVTVTGSIETQVERKIGEYTYRMPQVRVETLFLWPQRLDIERIEIYSDPFPFFGVYPWWPGPYYYH